MQNNKIPVWMRVEREWKKAFYILYETKAFLCCSIERICVFVGICALQPKFQIEFHNIAMPYVCLYAKMRAFASFTTDHNKMKIKIVCWFFLRFSLYQ